MFETSQDVLYLTVSICVALFTGFLVWIMYYIAQISRQSNEMIEDFRIKMEELDQSIKDIKEKVGTSIESITTVGEQVGSIMEIVTKLTGNKSTKKKRSNRKKIEDEN